MKTTGRYFATILFALVGSLVSYAVMASGEGRIVYKVVEGAYEDVLFDLNEALTEQGLVKNYTAHVAKMLNRTAKDVGATRTIYKNGDVVEFCSATLSRAAMEADPLNIALCPYSMFVYETVDEPGKIVIGYRRQVGVDSPASRAALDKVNALLEKMLNTVVEDYQ
ncbi:MAG: hypothetical protein Kow006_28910 [Gammaproteobacteria bacterium]